MKRIILLLALAAMVFMGCTKEDLDCDNPGCGDTLVELVYRGDHGQDYQTNPTYQVLDSFDNVLEEGPMDPTDVWSQARQYKNLILAPGQKVRMLNNLSYLDQENSLWMEGWVIVEGDTIVDQDFNCFCELLEMDIIVEID